MSLRLVFSLVLVLLGHSYAADRPSKAAKAQVLSEHDRAFSLALTSGNMNGTNFDALRVLAWGLLARAPREEIVPVNTSGGIQAAVTLVEDALIGGDISKTTDKNLRKVLDDLQLAGHLLDDPAKPLATIIGLALGSPEFQLR